MTLNVANKGLALMKTTASISFQLVASSITPITGTTGGGNLLYINGTGFSMNSTVTVDGNECKLVKTTYSLITCIVPSNVKSL